MFLLNWYVLEEYNLGENYTSINQIEAQNSTKILLLFIYCLNNILLLSHLLVV